MFWKGCLGDLTKAFLLIILCGSVQAVVSQDSGNAVWKDSSTGLVWTVKDNGSDVNWNQAGDYCGSLRLGRYFDWRLPTIDELEGMYDSRSSKEYKVKGPIEMSGTCALNATTNSSGEVWSFYFNYGGRSLARSTGHGSAGRALCVRSSGK